MSQKSVPAGNRPGRGPWEGRDHLWLLLWTLAAFAVRYVLAWFHPAGVSYWEDGFRMVAARDLLEGASSLPLSSYQADHYQGGTLVMVLLVAGMFRLLGEGAVALKLAGVLWSTATAAAFFAFARTAFDRGTACRAGALYALAPPLVLYWDLAVTGSHTESLLFSLLGMLCFVRMLEQSRPTVLRWFCFGLITGLGLWFCYTSGLSLAACGLTWLMLRGVPPLRVLLAAVSGTATGLIPWFLYNRSIGFTGAGRLVEMFGAGAPIDAWPDQGSLEKLSRLFLEHLPVGAMHPLDASLQSPAVWGWRMAFYIPSLLLVAVVLLRSMREVARIVSGAVRDRMPLATRRRSWLRSGASVPATGLSIESSAEILVAVYVVGFLLFYAMSSFVPFIERGAVAYRLYTPLLVVSLLACARGLSLLSGVDGKPEAGASATFRGRAARGLGGLLCVCLLASSGAGAYRLGTRPIEGNPAMAEGRAYLTWGTLLHRKFEGDLSRAFDEVAAMADSTQRFFVLQGIGWGLQYRYSSDGVLDPVMELPEGYPLEYQAAVWSGARTFTRLRLKSLLGVSEPPTVGAGLLPDPEPGRITREPEVVVRRLLVLQQKLAERWGALPAPYRFFRTVPIEDSGAVQSPASTRRPTAAQRSTPAQPTTTGAAATRGTDPAAETRITVPVATKPDTPPAAEPSGVRGALSDGLLWPDVPQ